MTGYYITLIQITHWKVQRFSYQKKKKSTFSWYILRKEYFTRVEFNVNTLYALMLYCAQWNWNKIGQLKIITQHITKS